MYVNAMILCRQTKHQRLDLPIKQQILTPKGLFGPSIITQPAPQASRTLHQQPTSYHQASATVMACSRHSEFVHVQLHGQRPSVTDRDFDADEHEFGVETEYGNSPFTFLSCPDQESYCEDHDYDCEPIAHIDAIVIAVDGACRGNGHPGAMAATGVFFHRNSRHNAASIVNDGMIPTNQRAELHAGLTALEATKRIRCCNAKGTGEGRIWPRGPLRKLRRVVIKSDSKFLVDGMTDWIYKWRSNDYTSSKGLPVANQDLFKQIEQAVEELNDLKVAVQFWHVGREQNRVADLIANTGLDGEDVDDAVDEYFEDY